ncbi:putative reverse transcriptase domain-containing protein [Tanacetum coccineum]|uniref:Reverse transcriptase domain-containing protein n=1 Tax=Tanacetum coccineum TaxID=301880 RepID=A0ABQ4WAK3_9ASTR
MTKLTQKKVKFEWGDKQEAAFQLLKQKLCSAPILALPEGSEDFIVYCDASKKGLGAVLMQREKRAIRTEKLDPRYGWKTLCINARSWFTSNFGGHFECLGTSLDMCTAYLPQTDGTKQDEHYTFQISRYVRACCDSTLEMAVPPFEGTLRLGCRSPVCWAEVGEVQLTGPEIVQETTEKIMQVKQRMQAARDRQKEAALIEA